MTYYYWQDATSKQWRWHLKAGNNKIIANSGESYYNEKDCLDAITLVKGSKDAPVKKI